MTWKISTASRALAPFQGQLPAWAGRPWKVKFRIRVPADTLKFTSLRSWAWKPTEQPSRSKRPFLA